MSELQYLQDRKCYLIKDAVLDGKKGLEATFHGSLDTSKADIYLDAPDGDYIGTLMLSNGKGENTSRTEIDGRCGVHDLYVKVKGPGVITDMALTETAETAPYEPVPEEKITDNGHDTWEATDMLGRKVFSVEDVGAFKPDKKVGIFYWTWREHAVGLTPVNVSKLLDEFPAAEYNRDHPGWCGKNIQPHWGEPRFGFYRNSDPYVIRHHAAMLADAGVDFLLFDCTNGALLWRDAYEPLLEGFRAAREDGINAPKIAFMLNFCPCETSEFMIRAIYQDLYKPGRYKDLWFMLDGKPMIMAYKESLPEKGRTDFETKQLDEIKNFFAFRAGQPLYGTKAGGPKRPDHWGWLEVFPQNKYGLREDGSCEMMTVGVGQNANDERICTCFNDKDTYGRSYTKEYGHALIDEDSYKYGYNVQEQWERALDISPDNVFVTGWNEWMMGLWHAPWIKDPNSTQLAMVDQYDREHSRDIEPDKDGYLDTYYLQLASNIRRFKGCKQRQKTSPEKTVGCFNCFRDVTPYYRADKGLTIHRDWPGFAGCYYKNDSGRNDITGAKIARDKEFIWLYAECSDDITEPADNWMTFYIDTDRDKNTGWEGYDIAVNRTKPENGVTCVERYVKTAEPGSFTWEKIGEAAVTVDKNRIMIKVPRALICEKRLEFEFKVSDNMQNADVMDFYENGCAAPLGRFNYLYKE